MNNDPERPLIRLAAANDVPALEAFIAPFVAQKRLLPRTTDELHALVCHGFVAELHGRIVGFAALEVYSPKLGELRSLAVADEWRGKGVGRQLVQACVDRAHKLNVLEVMAITSEEDFFKRCGFDFTLPGEKKALFIQTRDV
jgi:N-acetylglutamate synthase-like GNAT family acetyltransferase